MERAVALGALSLSGLAWGMLAGALARDVLPAAMLGVAFTAGSWAPLLLAKVDVAIVLSEMGIAGLATCASWRVFCGDDLTRRPAGPPLRNRRISTLSTRWLVVARLAILQGRWVIAGIVPGAFLLGCAASMAPIVVWPIGTAILGLACGLAAFIPDQNGGSQFLSAQRFPLGRFWAGKTLCWFVIMIGSTALAWHIGTDLVWFVLDAYFPSFGLAKHASEAASHSGEMAYWLDRWFGLAYFDKSLLHGFPAYFPAGSPLPAWHDRLLPIAIWPIYGFCFGHFFGLVARRAVIAVFLAVCTAGMTLALGRRPCSSAERRPGGPCSSRLCSS